MPLTFQFVYHCLQLIRAPPKDRKRFAMKPENFMIGTDQKQGSIDCTQQGSDSIFGGDSAVPVCQEHERNTVGFLEFLMGIPRIAADPDDLDSTVREYIDPIPIIAKLSGTNRRGITGIEYKQGRLRDRMQSKFCSVIGRQSKIGRNISRDQLHRKKKTRAMTG